MQESGIKARKLSGILPWVFVGFVCLSFLIAGYQHIFAQNYDYLVEASCDPLIELCYARDCESGECPPNELMFYKIFALPASEFTSCDDNTCANMCAKSADSVCTEYPCSEENGDTCSFPPLGA